MKALKKEIHEFLQERGWTDLHPADLAKSIVIESAELMEIFQWDNSFNKHEVTEEKLIEIKKELADVLIYCIQMGIMLDLDLEKIVVDKLEAARKKYPADIFTKDEAYDTAVQQKYLAVKKQHRADK